MPTQTAIAEHLGISQPAVSGQMSRLEIDWRAATLDEIRLAYIKHLRAVAAGHSSETGVDLAAERAMTERVTRQIKLLELAEKRGELVNVAQLEAGYQRMVDAFREAMLSLPDRVARDIKALHGIDVDVELINEHVWNALSELARHEPDGGDGAAPAGAPDEAARTHAGHGMGNPLPVSVGQNLGE